MSDKKEDEKKPVQSDVDIELEQLENSTEILQGDFIPGQEEEKSEPENEQPFNKDMAAHIGGGLMMVFSLLESKRGEHWALDQKSAMIASEAYAKFIAEKFPDMEVSATGGMIAATVVLFAGPVMGEVALAEAAKEAKAKKDKEDGKNPEDENNGTE